MEGAHRTTRSGASQTDILESMPNQLQELQDIDKRTHPRASELIMESNQ